MVVRKGEVLDVLNPLLLQQKRQFFRTERDCYCLELQALSGTSQQLNGVLVLVHEMSGMAVGFNAYRQ